MIRGLTGTFLGILLYLSLESKWGQKLFEIPLAGLFSALGISLYFFLNYSFTSILPFYLFSFFLVGACANNVPSLNLLRLKPCVWLGTISYSIYLLHIPLYTLLQTFLGDAFVKGFQGKLVLLPTLFVLSTLSYRWVEVPLQKQIRTLGFSFSKRKEYA